MEQTENEDLGYMALALLQTLHEFGGQVAEVQFYTSLLAEGFTIDASNAIMKTLFQLDYIRREGFTGLRLTDRGRGVVQMFGVGQEGG